jgi:hypothetical protein
MGGGGIFIGYIHARYRKNNRFQKKSVGQKSEDEYMNIDAPNYRAIGTALSL